MATMHIPIGPSGAGKSTLLKDLRIQYPNIVVFSWDLLRLEWYSPVYRVAWDMATNDPYFYSRATVRFNEIMETKPEDIYIDNMNLTINSRFQFVKAARKYRYFLTCYLLEHSMKELMFRHRNLRNPNKVPLNRETIEAQSRRIQPPMDNEFDTYIRIKEVRTHEVGSQTGLDGTCS